MFKRLMQAFGITSSPNVDPDHRGIAISAEDVQAKRYGLILPQNVQDFISSLETMKWFDNHGAIPDGVLMFDTWEGDVTKGGKAKLYCYQME